MSHNFNITAFVLSELLRKKLTAWWNPIFDFHWTSQPTTSSLGSLGAYYSKN